MPEKRSVLVGMPTDYQEGFFSGHFRRLLDAHPKVRVTVTDNPGQFSDLLPEADGAIFHPAYKFQTNLSERTAD